MRPFLEGSMGARPGARAIFCDGAAADGALRHGLDLELSHWIPNRTPARYKADTSTAICLRYLADPERDTGYQLAVNNHVDVDGLLSLYSLCQGPAALAHRDTLIAAAEMGDFQGWGELAAQHLFQAVSLLLPALEREASAEALELCFEQISAALAGEVPAAVTRGVAALARSCALLDSGQVERRQLGERLVAYRTPAALAEAQLARALAPVSLAADLEANALVLPHARARRDAERLQLLSTETSRGAHHELCYPAYSWAETPGRWRPPGLVAASSNLQRLECPELLAARAQLAARERAQGQWQLATSLTPFSALTGRGFPVVMAFVHHGELAPSALGADEVADVLAQVLAPALAGQAAGAEARRA